MMVLVSGEYRVRARCTGVEPRLGVDCLRYFSLEESHDW